MNRYFPLLILILAIFADVVSNNSVIRIFDVQIHFSSLPLTIVMVILQMLTAPIQASISDYYLRKISLTIALMFSFIGLIFLSFSTSTGLLSVIFLLIGLIINSCLGNTVPIAWSALADIQEKNLRFFLATSTSAYAIGYMLLAYLNKAVPHSGIQTSWLLQDIFMPLIIIGVAIWFAWKLNDPEDRKKALEKTSANLPRPKLTEIIRLEANGLSKELRSACTCFGLSAYLCWAASQYSSLILLVNSQKYSNSVIVMMIGYILGVIILRFCGKIRDEKIIRIAFIISLVSMVLFLILNPFVVNNIRLLSGCCFFYTLGNSFLTPSIFSLFSKEREIHDQGKGFGLIVSADSAGFLIGVIAEKVFNYFKIELEYVILFSLILFLISWLPYKEYEKRRRNSSRMKEA